MSAIVNTVALTLLLGGDVMTGRGIDQALPHPSSPALHEAYVTDARNYLRLAEDAHGLLPDPMEYEYVWGDALEEMERQAPDTRIINLETAITGSNDYWLGKGINYRMNPENIRVLTAAKIDAVALANNHVLDWGYEGLQETIRTLDKAGIRTAGAGGNSLAAGAPAVLDLGPKGRVLHLSLAHGSSGVPASWSAAKDRPGVNLVQDLSEDAVSRLAAQVRALKKPGDIAVLSIHWGANWGYDIPAEQVRFSHRVVESAGIDIVHGHSSHHVKPIEIYRDKLILYGCGDLVNDYEGIEGHESFRPDLALMYFARIDPVSGRLLELLMTPFQMRRFRLNRASSNDVRWLADLLNREGKAFGTGMILTPENRLRLLWKN